jgi:hypothetical protein
MADEETTHEGDAPVEEPAEPVQDPEAPAEPEAPAPTEEDGA